MESGEKVEWLLRPRVFGPLLAGLALLLGAALSDRGIPPNDEGALLTQAARLLRGAVFYRDLDAYPFPGAAHLLAFAFALFGEDVAVARGLAVAVFVSALMALYAAALELSDRYRAALFGLALLSVRFWAWPAFTAYLYSDLAFAGAAGSAAAFLGFARRGGRARLFAAGAGVGIALVSKQSLGIYLGLGWAALLLAPALAPGLPGLRERGRAGALCWLAAGAALPVAPFALHFGAEGVLTRLVESALLRPFTAYLPTSALPFAPLLAWWELGTLRGMPAFPYFPAPLWVMLTRGELPGAGAYGAYWLAGEIASRALYTALPLLFVWAGVRIARARAVPGPRDAALVPAALFAVAAVGSAFPRADFFHVVSVYPAAALLGLGLAGPGARRRRREAAGVIALLLGSGLLLAGHLVHLDHRLELERARLWVSPRNAWVASAVRFVEAEVPAGERLFVYGHEAYYYFLAQRFFEPWPFTQLYPGQAGGDGGRELAARLLREPPLLVLRGVLSPPGLPALPLYTPALWRVLRARFEPERRVFARFPPPAGAAPEPALLLVLRPRGDP